MNSNSFSFIPPAPMIKNNGIPDRATSENGQYGIGDYDFSSFQEKITQICANLSNITKDMSEFDNGIARQFYVKTFENVGHAFFATISWENNLSSSLLEISLRSRDEYRFSICGVYERDKAGNVVDALYDSAGSLVIRPATVHSKADMTAEKLARAIVNRFIIGEKFFEYAALHHSRLAEINHKIIGNSQLTDQVHAIIGGDRRNTPIGEPAEFTLYSEMSYGLAQNFGYGRVKVNFTDTIDISLQSMPKDKALRVLQFIADMKIEEISKEIKRRGLTVVD